MTQIMSHGKWVSYVPEKWPERAPPGALFCRRESDAADWYDYARDPRSFTAGSVKFTALRQAVGWMISVATRDAERLFPTDQLVLEIIDYHGADPQAELSERLFDPDASKLLDRPPPPLDPMQEILKGVLDRLAAIEAKLGM